MHKEVLRSIDGIEIYPILSLAIFGLFFVAMLIWVIKVDKKYIHDMSELPLSDGSSNDPILKSTR